MELSKKFITILISILCLSLIVYAAVSHHYVDSNYHLHNIYNVSNITFTGLLTGGTINGSTINGSEINVNSSTYWDGETSQADLNVNGSNYWDYLNTPLDITSVGTLTSLAVSGGVNLSLNWTRLQNYPTACSSGYAITQLDDAVTCTYVNDLVNWSDTNISDIYLSNTGDIGTGNYNFTKNVTQPTNAYHCFDYDCNSSIHYNGTSLVIKVN